MIQKLFRPSPVKKNRPHGLSIIAATFISSVFLSLLCSLLYNMWIYDVERIKREEGDFHARIVGEIQDRHLDAVKNFSNVKNAEINPAESSGDEKAVDIRLYRPSLVYKDMPRIAGLAGLGPDSIIYHESLLSLYLVPIPQDPDPNTILWLFLAIAGLAAFSLIAVIHSSFAVFINDQIRQIGTLSSIGAAPGQIRLYLLREAAALCIPAAVLGNLGGIAASAGILHWTNTALGAAAEGRIPAVFSCHPLAIGAGFFLTAFTVWVSAWIPARKASRMTPLEAMKNVGELHISSSSRLITHLFGLEGELAWNALRAQKKFLRTASLSLTLSILAFCLLQCFFTISGISTNLSYFEKYKDAWDIMITVKSTGINALDSEELREIQSLAEVRSAVAYQKSNAKRLISSAEISSEFRMAGGFEGAPESYVISKGESWLVNAPIIVLDDSSFLAYCRQIGAPGRLDGAIILNQVRDSRDPNFRKVHYLPYLDESQDTSVLIPESQDDLSFQIPAVFYTQTPPVLKESYHTYDYYGLVHILPASLWKTAEEILGSGERDSCIRILAENSEADLAAFESLEDRIQQILSGQYETEAENRIEDKISSDNANRALRKILGAFCLLLAAIGISSIFSNTLSFVRQRSREIARYLSIGMTPGGVQKMFFAEAMILALRPVCISLPLAAIGIFFFMRTAYLDPLLVLQQAPVLPIAAFLLAIFSFTALAYYTGVKKVLDSDLPDLLRTSDMM